MDFGFTSGGDAHIVNLRAMFTRRATTTLINRPGVTTVRQFIGHLDTTPGITKPIDDLLLGMHANNEGELFMPAFPGQRGPTTFERLDDTLQNQTRSIAIPDALIGFTPGSAITRSVHLKGCNIGQATPFLRKLKEALGGHVRITAPLHFHGATPAPQGMFEYMAYELVIRRATPFPSRAVALTEFDAAQFRLIDGTTVPTADWGALIPRNPNTPMQQQINSRLGVTLNGRTTIRTPRLYRVIPITFGPWTITFPTQADVPRTESDQLSALEISLGNDPRFKSSHPFPQFAREGFARVIEFVSGHTWNCQRRGATLVCTGRRVLYVVAVAVTDSLTVPANGHFYDGNLIFNFYPAAGSALPARTTGLPVGSTRFFATV